MKTIKVVNTGIEINVTNAKEMYMIFSRLNGWEDLEVDGVFFKGGFDRVIHTESYFANTYFKGE